VLEEHFPESLNVKTTQGKSKNHNIKENFYRAIKLFICKVAGNEKPCDRQHLYMQPGGNYEFIKDLLIPPCIHAEALSAGNMGDPSNKLALEWYYMLYHKNDCKKFMSAGEKIDTEMIKTVTEFFKALFMQKKLNRMLECHEMKRICKHAHQKAAMKLCQKIHCDKNCLHMHCARCEIASWDKWHCPYDNYNDQHCHINHNY
jgi:hypothetical protein